MSEFTAWVSIAHAPSGLTSSTRSVIRPSWPTTRFTRTTSRWRRSCRVARSLKRSAIWPARPSCRASRTEKSPWQSPPSASRISSITCSSEASSARRRGDSSDRGSGVPPFGCSLVRRAASTSALVRRALGLLRSAVLIATSHHCAKLSRCSVSTSWRIRLSDRRQQVGPHPARPPVGRVSLNTGERRAPVLRGESTGDPDCPSAGVVAPRRTLAGAGAERRAGGTRRGWTAAARRRSGHRHHRACHEWSADRRYGDGTAGRGRAIGRDGHAE